MTVTLDEATREELRREAERLAAEQEIDLKEARRIVWLDYLDEQAAYAATAPVMGEPAVTAAPPPPEPASPAGPEPPPARRPRYWDARQEPVLTGEWLNRNRAALARLKRVVGLRSEG